MTFLNLLQKLKHNRKTHWERAYEKQSSDKLSWYQDYPEISLRLIASTKVAAEDNIVDIGGGASKLADTLLQQGYKNLTVLDIAGNSIEKAKLRLGDKASKVTWIEADITTYNFENKYDIWHDRAVFHFLTDHQDRKRYINVLKQSLKPEGHVIISTFGLTGPKKCSGLKVARYNPKSLLNELGNDFKIIETFDEVHITPTGVKQYFVYCHFKKKT